MTSDQINFNNLKLIKFIKSYCEQINSKFHQEEVYDTMIATIYRLISKENVCLFNINKQNNSEFEIIRAANINIVQASHSFFYLNKQLISDIVYLRKRKVVHNVKKIIKSFKNIPPELTDINLIVSYPILQSDKVIGVFHIFFINENEFTPLIQSILDLIIKQAALTINQIELISTADKQTEQLITFREINEELSQIKSLDEILNFIAKESLVIVGKGEKAAFVFLLDRQKNMLECKAANGELLKKNQNYKTHISLSLQNIVTWVIKNNRLKFVKDVTKEPIYNEINLNAKSVVCIPLVIHTTVIGVIKIESSEINAFDEQDIELLQILADNTSIAIKIAELYNVRIKQLEMLYNTGTKINSSLNVSEVLSTIAKEALLALESRNRLLFVQLLDDQENTIEVKMFDGYNLSTNSIDAKVKSHEEVSKWVIKNQKYYLCSDIKNDSLYIDMNSDVRSVLFVPIVFNNKVIGLINVESTLENDFGEHEIELLELLANQAGIAIENARLQERITETQFRLRKTSESVMINETSRRYNHDIKTHTALILGDADWLKKLVHNNELTNSELITNLENIIDYTKHINKTIKELSTRSYISRPEFKKIKLSKIINEVFSTYANRIKKQGIKIDVKYNSFDFVIDIIENQILAVLSNLVENALDSMKEGGTLSLKLRKYSNFVYLKLRDTGKGIPKENLNLIWIPFFSTKTTETGTGLGLSICKSIIEINHKGKIQIESIENVKTTVAIKLPINQE